MPEIIKKPRKPKARATEVVIAVLQERINCIPIDATTEPHFDRIKSLLDELRRSAGNGSKESEEE